MPIDATKFPNLARMEEVQPLSQAIGEFIDWLSENGMAICKPEDGLRGDRYFPIMEMPEQLLARHFEVDLNGAERERRQVLAEHNAAMASKDQQSPAQA